MTTVPAPGLVLIRRPAIADTLPGGRIVLSEKTVRNWTAQQAEIVAVGAPAFPDDPDDYPDPLNDDGTIPLDERIVPGAWVLTRFRSWVATDTDGEYVCRQADLLGVFG